MFANSRSKRINDISPERVLKHVQGQDSDSSHEEIHERLYIVEKILEKKKFNGTYKYKVKWEGFPYDQCTWEPFENLKNVQGLIEEFEKRSGGNQSSKKPSKVIPLKNSGNRKTNTKFQKKPLVDGKNPETDEAMLEFEDSESAISEVISSRHGHFRNGDKPKCIKNAITKETKILFVIEWEQEKNGDKIQDSIMDSDEVRKYNKDLIIDYYLSHIRIAQMESQSPQKTPNSVYDADNEASGCESLESDMSQYSVHFRERLSEWLIKKGQLIRKSSIKKAKEKCPPQTRKFLKKGGNIQSRAVMIHEDISASEEDLANASSF